MADYIRRDIVLKIINTVNDTGGFAGYADYCVLFDEIDTMPAADVQPIRRGRWIFTEKLILGNPYGSYKCSECMYHVPHEDNYCPNCGARMDLNE